MTTDSLSGDLQEDAYSIAHTRKTADISYPSTGNDLCFQLEDKSFWFRHRNNCILEAVRKYPPNGEILDIGGGNGYVTRRLIDEGYPSVLLEPGLSGAYNGKVGRNLPHVICGTLEDLSLSDSSISAAGCFDVIEHVEDDVKFVSEIARVFIPGGLLYTTFPAYQWLWSACDDYSGHFRRYNIKTIDDLLGEHFNIIYYTYFFGCLTAPLLLLKSAPYHLGIIRKRPNFFSNETEHGTSGGLTASLIELMLKNETKMIREGRRKTLGTSCLVVASRKSIG
ncbi:MAG: methyltransferase domain-containing protein [Synergistota bacterium]|nr:methyltransferase domain-containing protein [Synergistota bacterium]